MSDRASDPLRVTLKPAFAFECPRCGETNFVAAAPFTEPLSIEDAARLADYEGDFLIAPSIVGCKGCGVHFETRDDA